MTTLQNFVQLAEAALVGTTVSATGALVALNPANATEIANNGGGAVVDRPVIDLSKQGFAKNGAASYTLVGTTPVTCNLTNLATAAAFSAGDTVFATWNQIIFYNAGTADATISPGGSNPAAVQLAGTTPTLTVAAGSYVILQSVAGIAITSSLCDITITPTAGGNMVVAVGGA